MDNAITVIIPEWVPARGPEVMPARQSWSPPAEISLEALEKALRDLLSMFNRLDSEGGNFQIDETKVTVGATKDNNGNIKLGLSAKILGLLSGEGSAQIEQSRAENQLFEIRIKRKVQSG